MRMDQGRWVLCMMLFSGVLAAGCVGWSGCDISRDAGARTEVCNDPGSLKYSKESESLHYSDDQYSWENPRGGVDVYWAANIQEGDMTVNIWDAEGKEVYGGTWSGAGRPPGQEQKTGAPGTWTVQMVAMFEGHVVVTCSAVDPDQDEGTG